MSAASDMDQILVVEDDEEFRRFLHDLFVQAGFGVREAADGREAVAAARADEPSLVVLDVCLPGISGYEVLRQLQDTVRHDLPIIFTSGQRPDKNARVTALLLGADDYLVKPFEPDELLARVRRSLARTGSGNGRSASAPAPPLAALTAREVEVLSLLADGLSQSEIAAHLVLSPRTVGTHIQRILTKLDVHSRSQAVALALRNGNGHSDVLAHAVAAEAEA